MKIRRTTPLLFRLLFAIAALATLIWVAPGLANRTVHAQESAPAATAPSAQAQQSGANQESNSSEDEEKRYLESPSVKAIARILHLDIKVADNIFLFLNFAIVALAIVIPLAKVMPKLFRKRREALSQKLDEARKTTADANARLSAVEAKLSTLDDEIAKLRAQVEQESLEDEKRIKASIGEESARIVSGAEQEIAAAAAQARRGLRSFAAELAIDQATRQISLTPETDRALIAEFVATTAKGGKN